MSKMGWFMKIDNHVMELIDKADTLQKKLDNYEKGAQVKVTQSEPGAIVTSDAETERKGSVNHRANYERRRIARLAARDPEAAKQQSAQFEASMQKTRPMTQIELLEATQQTRCELAKAEQAKDSERVETARRKLRALHRDRARRGSIRVAC